MGKWGKSPRGTLVYIILIFYSLFWEWFGRLCAYCFYILTTDTPSFLFFGLASSFVWVFWRPRPRCFLALPSGIVAAPSGACLPW